MTTHLCNACNTPVEVGLVETTILVDLARGYRTYTWGRPEQCKGCGSNEMPALAVDDTDLLTQPFDNSGWTILPTDLTDPRWAGVWQPSAKETSQ